MILADLIHYLTTPTDPALRRAGFLTRAVALWSRGRRCALAWAPHEARTKAAIDRAIDRCDRRRTVVVLGSGLLRDVPIDRLRAMFREVVLVDAVHLAAVRLRARLQKWDNVTFVARDLSGLDDLAEHRRVRRAIGKDDIGARLDPLRFLRRYDELDLVISANLLSQIAVAATARIATERPLRLMPEDTIPRLIRAHLDGLAAQECATVLITDVESVLSDRTGAVLERIDLMAGVTLPPADDSWTWPVAPFGEEAPDRERVHRVVAIQDVAVDLAVRDLG